MCRQRTLTARNLVEAAARDGFRGFKGLKLGKRCAGKGQAATLEQQRLTARGLGGSCREEAMRIVRVVAGGARDLEGCKSWKRLKPGNGKLECLNNRGL